MNEERRNLNIDGQLVKSKRKFAYTCWGALTDAGAGVQLLEAGLLSFVLGGVIFLSSAAWLLFFICLCTVFSGPALKIETFSPLNCGGDFALLSLGIHFFSSYLTDDVRIHDHVKKLTTATTL